MRHRIAGKHLNRTASHRKALRRNLAASLIEHGTIRTTPAKAKEVRPFVERLITIAGKGTLHARRRVIALLQDRAMVDKENRDELAEQTVVQKLFDEVAPRYVDRSGGYTRIIRLPERRIGDAGQQVLLQLVEESPAAASPESPGTTSARRRRAARRAEAAKAATDQAEAGTAGERAEDAEADEQGESSEKEKQPDQRAEAEEQADQE